MFNFVAAWSLTELKKKNYILITTLKQKLSNVGGGADWASIWVQELSEKLSLTMMLNICMISSSIECVVSKMPVLQVTFLKNVTKPLPKLTPENLKI